MKESIPLEAVILNINFNEYSLLAKNVKRMMNLSLFSREKIISRADRELSKETKKNAIKLLYSVSYDREFYKMAGLKYFLGPPKGQKLFSSAICDYLLRKQ